VGFGELQDRKAAGIMARVEDSSRAEAQGGKREHAEAHERRDRSLDPSP
jgi:hypothetical protein